MNDMNAKIVDIDKIMQAKINQLEELASLENSEGRWREEEKYTFAKECLEEILENLLSNEEEIRADERQQFAECLKDRFSQIVVPGCMSFLLSRKTNSIIDQVLEEYQKEHKMKPEYNSNTGMKYPMDSKTERPLFTYIVTDGVPTDYWLYSESEFEEAINKANEVARNSSYGFASVLDVFRSSVTGEYFAREIYTAYDDGESIHHSYPERKLHIHYYLNAGNWMNIRKEFC